MNKIESFKYIRLISLSTTSCNSIGDFLPIEITWECNGSMYNRKQEKGGLCAILSEYDNVIGVVENPYTGGYNSAYVLSATNQIIWNVSVLTEKNLYFSLFCKQILPKAVRVTIPFSLSTSIIPHSCTECRNLWNSLFSASS